MADTWACYPCETNLGTFLLYGLLAVGHVGLAVVLGLVVGAR